MSFFKFALICMHVWLEMLRSHQLCFYYVVMILSVNDASFINLLAKSPSLISPKHWKCQPTMWFLTFFFAPLSHINLFLLIKIGTTIIIVYMRRSINARACLHNAKFCLFHKNICQQGGISSAYNFFTFLKFS